MGKINCNVIQDILPLYIEDVFIENISGISVDKIAPPATY